MKRCCGCGEAKPLDQFPRDRSRKEGLYARCKECACRKWRDYAERNRAVVRARDRARDNGRRREYMTAKRSARRARARHRVRWYDSAAVRRLYRTAAWLRELGVHVHVDHTVPLRGRTVCGLHVQNNLRLAFARENLRKGARRWPDGTGPVAGQFLRVALDGQPHWHYPLEST